MSAPTLPAIERPATAPRKSSLLAPQKRASELGKSLDRENEAKRVAAAQLRVLRKTATAGSRLVLFASRRENVAAIQREWAEETGKDIAERLKEVEPASEKVVTDLANKINLAMCHVWPESRSQSTYFRLFKYMDRDGSGLISFYELTKMIRELLRLGPTKMSEDQIMAVWRWVDTDEDVRARRLNARPEQPRVSCRGLVLGAIGRAGKHQGGRVLALRAPRLGDLCLGTAAAGDQGR